MKSSTMRHIGDSPSDIVNLSKHAHLFIEFAFYHLTTLTMRHIADSPLSDGRPTVCINISPFMISRH